MHDRVDERDKYAPPGERLVAVERQVAYLEGNHNKLEAKLEGRIEALEERLTNERELRIGYEGRYNGAKAVLLAVGIGVGWLASKINWFIELFGGGKAH
jgi:hypothetical protein